MAEAPDHLQFDQVRFSASGAAEMDGERPLVFVPAADIVRVELLHGVGAENPFVTGALGVLLLGIAVFPVLWLVLALLRHGVFYDKAIAAVGFVFPAWWLLDLSFRRRWFVRLHTRKGTRKLLFKSGSEPELHAFVGSVRSRFGYA
jgi:hypothetical protein